MCQSTGNQSFYYRILKKLNIKKFSEQRIFWIHVPNINGGNENTCKGSYPVIYLLDGDANFNEIVSIILKKQHLFVKVLV